MNRAFWKNRKVLVTGHTGFKGSWLCIWLAELGAKVIGYGLDPKNVEDNFVTSKVSERITDIRGDIRNRALLQKTFDTYQPEIVFHLAAQPLVRLSYEEPFETYEINVMGTLNVLEAIRKTDSVAAGVMITTDKCYENKETLKGYVETDAFGGYDPYSSSKACDEILIASYRSSYMNPLEYEKHHKAIASVRAGNVIGGGDWALDRIVPDCIRAIEEDEPIKIRNPHSVRPFQHVLEPLSGYMLLAERLYENPKGYGEGWNFGPREDSIWTVWNVASSIIKYYGKGELLDASGEDSVHEAAKLMLNIDKAEVRLDWHPGLNVDTAIAWTVEWYKNRFSRNTHDICVEQIERFGGAQ